jgi:type IV pilus assembly protein PilF
VRFPRNIYLRKELLSFPISTFLGLVVCAALTVSCTALPGGAAGSADGQSVVATQAQEAAQDNTDLRRRAKIRLELAVNYFQQKQIKTALDESRQAIAIDPAYADAYSLRAIMLSEIGESREAEAEFKQALRLAPQDSDINNSYGWFLCQNSREKEAISYFVAAARNPLYETPGKPLQNAGICSMRMKDYPAAETFLIRAFEVEPASVVAIYNLALLYLRMNDFERATFYSERLNKMIEPSAESLWLAIRIAHKKGDRQEKDRWATQLRRKFLSSREWSAYQRGAFDD